MLYGSAQPDKDVIWLRCDSRETGSSADSPSISARLFVLSLPERTPRVQFHVVSNRPDRQIDKPVKPGSPGLPVREHPREQRVIRPGVTELGEVAEFVDRHVVDAVLRRMHQQGVLAT